MLRHLLQTVGFLGTAFLAVMAVAILSDMHRMQDVAFVRPSEWLGSWREIAPEVAAREIIRRFLWVYGPATPQDFGRWWGAGTRLATKKFKELQPRKE